MNYIFIRNTTGHTVNIFGRPIYPRHMYAFIPQIHKKYHIKHGSKIVAVFKINRNSLIHHLHATGIVKKSAIMTSGNYVSKLGTTIKLLEFGKAYGYGNEPEFPLFQGNA